MEELIAKIEALEARIAKLESQIGESQLVGVESTMQDTFVPLQSTDII